MLVQDAELVPYRVFLAFGWEPTWSLSLGGVIAIDEAVGGHDLGIELALTVPVALITTLSDWKITGGVGLVAPLGDDVGFGLGVDLKTGLAMSDDAASRNLAWVFELSVAPGYYGSKAAVALELGWRAALATYVAHHELVAGAFADRYPDARTSTAPAAPRDAWYPFAASRVRAGVLGHVALGDVLRVFGSAGLELTGQAQGVVSAPPWLKPPFYGALGVDASW